MHRRVQALVAAEHAVSLLDLQFADLIARGRVRRTDHRRRGAACFGVEPVRQHRDVEQPIVLALVA
eukprot:940262-Prymnesium_polylepis.2